MAINVVMLGPPGAGKGTQGERFAMGHRIQRISTGDMLRDEMHKGSALGKAVQAVMDRGELVSDQIMIDMVTERLSRHDADGRESTPGVCQICGGKLTQRADDNAMVVLERFKVYQVATKPLVDFYRDRPTFRSIDGAQAKDRVAADLVGVVEAITSGAAKVVSGGGTR